MISWNDQNSRKQILVVTSHETWRWRNLSHFWFISVKRIESDEWGSANIQLFISVSFLDNNRYCFHWNSLLSTSGGYYLTSAYGAMALIKNFQEEQAARVLTSEARNTLYQWHRRRTAQRSSPTVDDFQVSHLTWVHLEHPGSESKLYQIAPKNPHFSGNIENVHERCWWWGIYL